MSSLFEVVSFPWGCLSGKNNISSLKGILHEGGVALYYPGRCSDAFQKCDPDVDRDKKNFQKAVLL